METTIVGLIGVAAAGYLTWRGYNALGKNNGCAAGNCAGCNGCGCQTASRKSEGKSGS